MEYYHALIVFYDDDSGRFTFVVPRSIMSASRDGDYCRCSSLYGLTDSANCWFAGKQEVM